MSVVIGLDPGAGGAVALLASILARSHARVAYVEFTSARPRNGGAR